MILAVVVALAIIGGLCDGMVDVNLIGVGRRSRGGHRINLIVVGMFEIHCLMQMLSPMVASGVLLCTFAHAEDAVVLWADGVAAAPELAAPAWGSAAFR